MAMATKKASERVPTGRIGAFGLDSRYDSHELTKAARVAVSVAVSGSGKSAPTRERLVSERECPRKWCRLGFEPRPRGSKVRGGTLHGVVSPVPASTGSMAWSCVSSPWLSTWLSEPRPKERAYTNTGAHHHAASPRLSRHANSSPARSSTD